MTGPVSTSITRVPAGENPPEFLVEGKPLVAIVSMGPFNTPDLITASGRRTTDNAFALDVDIRRFDGPLAANVQWIARIRMDLGPLAPGDYRVWVHETTSRFTDLHHPETTTGQKRIERSFDFVCE